MTKAETRIAVFYPWTGLPALDRGSSRRVVPLINLFGSHFGEVKVLSPGSPQRIAEANVEYLFHDPTAAERMLLLAAHYVYDGMLHHLSRGFITARERRQWWHYLSVRFQPSLRREVHRLVAWSSIAFLECPFWDSAVRGVCRRTGKNYLLTFEDVLSDLVTSNRWLRGRVIRCEQRASRGAASVFSVSVHDQQRFNELGIATRVVPHGMETEPPMPAPGSVPASPELLAIEKARSDGKMVCLFIGSSLRCNQEAVEAIQVMAAAVANRENVSFAIAGACLPKGGYGENVIAFGPVDEATLLRLYQLGDIVLAPLISGTGTSLKVLEAFVHGKTLLTTQVGVRGHPVRDGRDCLICDDLGAYPEILLSLSADPVRRRHFGEGGRQFVKAFDYRRVYQPYLEAIARFAR